MCTNDSLTRGRAERDECVKGGIEYIKSPEGQRELRGAVALAESTRRNYREARQLDPDADRRLIYSLIA